MKYDEFLSQLFDLFVPASGAAQFKVGEICRAYSKIKYRWYNDGDCIGCGYGNETCNAPARYLMQNTNSKIKDYIEDNMWGEEYDEKELNHLTKLISDYINSNNHIFIEKNHDDMLNYFNPNEDAEQEYYSYYDEELEENWV